MHLNNRKLNSFADAGFNIPEQLVHDRTTSGPPTLPTPAAVCTLVVDDQMTNLPRLGEGLAENHVNTSDTFSYQVTGEHDQTANLPRLGENLAESHVNTSDACSYQVTVQHKTTNLPRPGDVLAKNQHHVNTSDAFPYLDTKSMDQLQKLNLLGKLLKDTNDTMFEFSDLIHYTINSLKANPEVTVEVLSSRLATLGTYKSIHVQKPLLQDRLEDIQRCKTIDGVFLILPAYFSFFNHGIIDKVIGWFGTLEDKKRLEEYTKHFEQFCRRRTFECPPDIFGQITESGRRTLVVKLDEWEPISSVNPSDSSIALTRTTLNQILQLRNTLAETLGVTSDTLYLCRIDEGCVELLFQIPSFVEEDLFPLSIKQERSLDLIGVARLTCGNYNFPPLVIL